jgi:thymidylate synthase ThyX
MRETTPQVELIARPAVDLDALQRYLKTVGGESWLEMRRAEEDGLNPGQLLVEAAGRACYRSWEEGLNPNVRKVRKDQGEYFLNILRSGHGSVLEHSNFSFIIWDVSRIFCYDADTEVLTDRGWVPWPKIDGTETFGTLNPETGELEYQKATERFEGDYEGPMYRVKSEQVDLLVTPQHRMWIRRHDTQAARRREQPWEVSLASEIAGKRVHYQKCALWRGQEEGMVSLPPTTRTHVRRDTGKAVTRPYPGAEFPLLPFARFLGLYLAEGSINGHQICIAQNRGEALEGIASDIRALGLPTYIPRTGPGSVRTQQIALRDFLASCGSRSYEKRVPAIVHAWGPKAIRVFLEAMVDGDGSRRKDRNHAVIYTASPELADDLQVLAIKAGWSANVRIDDRTGLERTIATTGQKFYNLRPCFIVSLVKTRIRPLVNHGSSRRDGWVDYEGKVYCVKVPNGLLFVRRNGKPVVSGNTHELVRHRAGSAFSQESLRFVRLKDIGFRIPESLEPLRPRIISILETLEEFQISAAEEFGLDEEGVSFHDKKTITSALRRLAPEGLSTMIVWTANVRTLRHVIQARTDPGAEEELRFVFNKIGEIMRDEAPLLFGDFVVEDGAWITEYKKV